MKMVEVLKLGLENPTKQIGRVKPSAEEGKGISNYAKFCYPKLLNIYTYFYKSMFYMLYCPSYQ